MSDWSYNFTFYQIVKREVCRIILRGVGVISVILHFIISRGVVTIIRIKATVINTFVIFRKSMV